MIEYAMVFAGSLLASAHCVGMCGCFALMAGGSSNSLGSRLSSQALFTTGRLFSYITLGALAGGVGLMLLQSTEATWVRQALSIVSGVLFLGIGLEITGVWNRMGKAGGVVSRILTAGLGPLIRHFASRQHPAATFAMGVFTGLLPCGLVYAFAMRAVATGSGAAGALTMFAFGLGTVPAMLGVGFIGSLISVNWRRHVYRWSGVVMIILGMATVARATPWACQILGHQTVAEKSEGGTCCHPETKSTK
jgi:sulfite exporter TauE/SafE